MVVRPAARGFSLSVHLDQPLPARLEGRAGLNLEFLPSAYFEKTYLMDGKPGIFPLYPSGPMRVRPAATQITQFAGHTTFDDRGRGEYVEAEPIAVGKTLVLAPEDPERHVTIEAVQGELTLLDGRNVAQNGWYVVRTLLPANATGKVAEWSVRPHTIEGWKRTPVVGFSQAGYHPAEKKVAVIELDPGDVPLETASVFQVTADGATVERLKGKVQPWGRYLRYSYASFDFSSIQDPGLYFIRYGSQRTETFPVAADVYRDIWHQTLDVWFPVQMDHMFVNEAYRVWHGAAHLDDARQAPVGVQHFDGYRMGPSTETKYAPGERIPGLNIGGWFDAGDYDIRTGSHAATVMHLVEAWERFKPTRDETLVDQAGRFVDIHRPDGKPDLLQQIEHGALALVAQHRAFGRAIPGIIEPQLHQYHHLGDGVTQTDGLVYDPAAEALREGRATVAARPTTAGPSRTSRRRTTTCRPPRSRPPAGPSAATTTRSPRSASPPRRRPGTTSARRSGAAETGWEAMFRQGAELTATLQLLITTSEKLVRRPVRGADLAGSRPRGRSQHRGGSAGSAAPRPRVRGPAAAVRPQVQGRDRRPREAEPLRRSHRHARLGRQRGGDRLGGHELPPPPGLSRPLRLPSTSSGGCTTSWAATRRRTSRSSPGWAPAPRRSPTATTAPTSPSSRGASFPASSC